MDVFTKTTTNSGQTQFRNLEKSNTLVAKENIPEEALKALETEAEGTPVRADGTIGSDEQQRAHEVLAGNTAAGAKAKVIAAPNVEEDYFVKQTQEDGTVQYRDLSIGNVVVAPETLTPLLIEKLNIAEEGRPVRGSDALETTNVPEAGKKFDGQVKFTPSRNLLVNGQAFIAGKEYRLRKDVAEDLQRMQETTAEYEQNLLKGADMTGKGAEIKAGDLKL